MTTRQKIWLSVYLYYSPPWEEFLLKAVHPFLEKVFEKKLADQYFFIRYFERGPHIRLRFKGDKEVLEKDLKPLLFSYFSHYFSQFPSNRIASSKFLESKKWYPNNSIQFVTYKPEIRRYGGKVGIEISEQHFQTSSSTILELLKDKAFFSYEKRVGVALQLHIAFFWTTKMKKVELIHFLDNQIQHLQTAFHVSTPVNKYEELLTEEAHVINKLIVLWHDLKNKRYFKETWYNDWIRKTNNTMQKLKKAEREKKLLYSSLSSILESYIHMTNNRLGISNNDEPLIAYILKRCFENI